jgi:small conductance mechanosensitive channel
MEGSTEQALTLASASAQQAANLLVALVSTWGLRVIGALAVLIIGRWIAGRIRKGVRRALEQTSTDATLIPFFAGTVYYLVIAVVVIAVLNLFGVETTSLIAVLGAAGLAVGLALQGTLSNFASGVMILIFRPIHVGDYVDIAGTAGSVVEIGLFTVTLNTPDNVRIIVPNSSVYGQTITNYAANATRRNDLIVGISYDDDIGKAIATIEKILSQDPRVLEEPAAVVAASELGDSSVNLVVRPWCSKDDYWSLRFDLTRRFKEGLEAAGCTIPFPQRDVHLFRADGNGKGAARDQLT